MKVTTGPRFPLQFARTSLRGRVTFQLFRGQLIAKAWPRKRGPKGTEAQLAARADFVKMVRAVQDMSAADHSAAIEIAKGTSYTWRDVLSRAVNGKLINLTNYYEMMNPYILDTFSDVVGAILVRTEAGWVGLVPGDDGQILELIDGLPAWADPPPSEHALIPLVTGEIPAAFIVDPAGQLILVESP